MELKEKIKNSIKAYILGDVLGVPFEFKKKGTFKCSGFVGFGTYNKPAGTWSDDTTILLCLIDALTKAKLDIDQSIEILKDNLEQWYYHDKFTIDGLFDIGNQTSNAIESGFSFPESENMGNGAMFYSLPIACLLACNHIQSSESIFEKFCRVTHNNKNCFKYGSDFSLILKNLFLSLPTNLETQSFRNHGDVVSTYNMTTFFFNLLKDKGNPLLDDLCCIINEGKDTDTNAAFLGALMGTIKEVKEKDWEKVRKCDEIDSIIDNFIDLL